MTERGRLALDMSLREFDHGYWYAVDLKAFAKQLGIPGASKLRKDELELALRVFLKTGRAEVPTARALSQHGAKDVERGLSLGLPIVRYTNDRETKGFLEQEALKLDAHFKPKSGARYRLNRWREEQLTTGVPTTYGDLVHEYVRLCQLKGPFEQIPHGRYINFTSDYYAAQETASRDEILAAWEQLKSLDLPKSYKAWARWKRGAR